MSIQLPDAFVTKMKNLLQEEGEAFLDSYKEQRTAGIRVNTLKLSAESWESICPFPIKKIPFTKYGYYYDYQSVEPGKHPYHAAGLYYVQEPSAMSVAPLLDIKPGEKVLDLCAAPGGKSTQIGASLNNQGLLISNEIHPKRAKALAENIERFGLTNAIVTNETPEKLANHFPSYFDKILLDAPCSGEGMFRKDEEARNYWSEEHVKFCSRRQLEILDNAYRMLKGGGILVYSTCTFSPEENEQVIEQFLRTYPDMQLMNIEKHDGIEGGRPEWTRYGLQDVKKCARLWPHKLQGEGHFAAKLIKTSAQEENSIMEIKTKKNQNLKDFTKFEMEYLQNISWNKLHVFGSVVHSLPKECPDLSGLKVLRAGLHIGELKKNRFEPNHALALALKSSQFRQTINLTEKDGEWKRFLKGETLKGTGQYKGWVLIMINGFPLGWGKESNGMVKNLYPKGLRWM